MDSLSDMYEPNNTPSDAISTAVLALPYTAGPLWTSKALGPEFLGASPSSGSLDSIVTLRDSLQALRSGARPEDEANRRD